MNRLAGRPAFDSLHRHRIFSLSLVWAYWAQHLVSTGGFNTPTPPPPSRRCAKAQRQLSLCVGSRDFSGPAILPPSSRGSFCSVRDTGPTPPSFASSFLSIDDETREIREEKKNTFIWAFSNARGHKFSASCPHIKTHSSFLTINGGWNRRRSTCEKTFNNTKRPSKEDLKHVLKH